MSNDLISRSALFKELFVRNGKVCPDTDVDNFPITFNAKDIKAAIKNAPTAYDVDKVVEQLEENSFIPGLMHGVSEIKVLFKDAAIEIVKAGGVSEDCS